MKGYLISLSLLLAMCAQARMWTAADGRKVDAELKSCDLILETVVLINQRGREFTLKLNQLSAADQEYLQAAEAERLQKEAALQAQIEEQRAAAEKLAGTSVLYTSDGEYGIGFHCRYPSSYTGDDHPVLILFHPNGSGGGIINNFIPAAEEHGWLLVGCNRFKNGLDDDECERWFQELLPYMEKTLPINPDRMYLGGFSGGAMRAYHYSAKFDRPWKGIIACGGWLGGAEYENLKYPRKMAVAMVNGNADSGANAWADRDRSSLSGRSCKVDKFEFEGGHTMGPPEVISEAVAWVVKNTRD